jgi:hypothetical protein
MSNLKIVISSRGRTIYKYKNIRGKYLILMTDYVSFLLYNNYFNLLMTFDLLKGQNTLQMYLVVLTVYLHNNKQSVFWVGVRLSLTSG